MTKYIINKKPFFGTLEEFFKCAKREHEKDLDKAGLLDKEKRKKILVEDFNDIQDTLHRYNKIKYYKGV